VYDDTASAGKILDTAAYLAQLHDVPLIVFIVTETVEEAEAHKHHASEHLRHLGIQVGFRQLIKPTLSQLADRIRGIQWGRLLSLVWRAGLKEKNFAV
jgi:hypothetical protein